MRGSPIWQVLGVVLMFALASIPVLRLTSPAAPVLAATTPVVTQLTVAPTTLVVEVSFTPAPADFSLRYLGENVVLSGQGPTADFTGHWTVQLPPEGADLVLQAHWPDGTSGHAAAHLTVRFPDGRETAQTFWSDAGHSLVETLTVTP